MKKRNYRENFFISEKFSVIYLSKERAYFITVVLCLISESNSYQKFGIFLFTDIIFLYYREIMHQKK